VHQQCVPLRGAPRGPSVAASAFAGGY
jgi:hypothetical protein